MKLLVVVLCLLSERFLIHQASSQRFYWFGQYSQKIMTYLGKKEKYGHPLVVLAALVLPIVVLFSILYILFHSILFGFLGFLLSLIVFFYCLGPHNPFYPLAEENSKDTDEEKVKKYFVAVNSQLFSVLFWYLILGPIGALTYRLITLCRHVPKVQVEADNIANVLEWVPTRIAMLLFLLAGNFQKGFGYFISSFVKPPELNNDLIGTCGVLAMRANDTDEIPLPVAEVLVEYAVVIYLVVIALFTLAAWI